MNEYFDSSCKIVESKQRNPEILPVPMVAKWCKTWLQKSEAFGQKCLISQPCFLLLSRASTASTASTLFFNLPRTALFSYQRSIKKLCLFMEVYSKSPKPWKRPMADCCILIYCCCRLFYTVNDVSIYIYIYSDFSVCMLIYYNTIYIYIYRWWYM